MKCLACKSESVFEKVIEEKLKVNECKDCGGQWLPSAQYYPWLERHGQILPEVQYSEVTYEVIDSQNAKLCPDCGRILLRFKVGHGLQFSLDHCSNCNGVWFDKNEWKALVSRNLHDELPRIFSTEWQKHIRKEERAKYYEEVYSSKFGDQYNRIKEFKQWLEELDLKPAILAFLSDPNPYE